MSTPSKSQDLKERLAGLSEEQRLSLLAKMRDRSSGGEKPDHGIEKADPISVEKRQNPHGETVEVKIYEASNTEESMLFLIDYFAGEPVYTSPMAFHLTGQLNPDLLEESLNVLVARHGVLRTLFEYAESGLVQCEFSKVHLDLTRKAFDGPLEESRTKAEAYAKKHAKKCFDSSREFPISAHYLTIGSEESVVIIVLSHIVSDGWSRSNFCRELCDVFAQLESGKAVKAEANALQMPDYSNWQRCSFQRSNNSDHLNYWKKRFEENHTPLELPTDYPRSKEITCNGDSLDIELEDELVESLKMVARENGATLFMLGLAAFKTLLLGYTGQKDIVVGTPTANRSRPEFESMIGCFINTLAIRSEADDRLSFSQYLDQIRATCVEAYHHESVPFSEVASELDVERSGGSSPTFKTIFALQDFPEVSLSFDGLQCTDWGVRTQTAKVDVYLNLEKFNGDWISIMEYNSDLFSRESMERFSRNWKNLLERIVANPDQQLTELATLSESVTREVPPTTSLTFERSSSQQTVSCYVIGSGRVIVDSVEMLRGAGIDVRGLISKDASVLEWAKKEKLNYSNRPDELETFLSKDPFDYLFSINNPKVLSEDIISIPVKGSINFHDAPLPRYGGVNAMYWAFINKETSWAVTWHLIDHQIDAGPIIKQVPVEVFEDDTTITLGLRCTEAGLTGLRELIPGILKGEFQVTKQNAEDRTYNNRLKRETAGGIIDWSKTADDLEVEHRALRFGPTYNPIQCLKVIAGDLVLIPNQVTPLESADTRDLGTVLEITDASITIQVKDSSLRLEKLRDINGCEIIPSQLQDEGSLKEGDRLPLLTTNEKEGVRKLEEKAIRGQSFWKKRLSSLIPVSFQKDLREDRPQTPQYEAESLSIDQNLLTGSINDFASPLLIAAWGAFIGRILNETEFDIELVPFTNSRYTHLEKSIFSESLPFRVLLESGELGGSLIDRISNRLNVRKKYPLIIKDLLIRDPELSHALAQGELGSLPIGIVFCEAGEVFDESNYQAFLKVDREGGIDLVWDRSILNEQEATGLASSFETFLQHFAQESEALWEKLPFVAEEKLEELIELGKGAPVEGSPLAHRMFEKHASEMPDEIALQHEDESLTFRELNEQANILAHHLKTCGVGPEKKVGILMERSIESVISIFAILKAGGAYVPLDATYPEERLEMMISDAGLIAILTKSQVNVSVPESTQMIAVDKYLEDDSPAEHRLNPQSDVKPGDLAYVIYTSGSSGKPKGVQIEHKSLSNYACVASKEYGISKTDRVLQFASLSFESSVEEIFCSLCTGARLVLRTDDTISSFSSFVSDCERWGITFLPLPTAFWHSLVAHWKIDSFLFPNSVKTVVLGGEAMSASHLATWRDLIGKKVRLVNGYGPTEVTVVATTFDVTHFDQSADDSRIPIGRPLSGYQTYVLDRNLNLVPPGVEGELCVGGIGLARGYLNQPEETRDKFIKSSFPDGNSSRLYRTGDRVVQLSSGTLIYLGRMDEQLKVRGFRLEPKEIEEKLCALPDVKECAVTASSSENGQKNLLAYYVPADSKNPPERDALQAHMEAHLPEYMIPQQFVQLERIPLTPNGKVDFKGLAKMAPVSNESSFTDQSESFSEGQKVMVAVWKELFENVEIGLDDSFFKIGGHSLLATQLISRLHSRYSRDIKIRDIFDFQTIRELTSKYPCQQSLENQVDPAELQANEDQSATVRDFRAIPENARILKEFTKLFSDLLDKEQVSADTDFFHNGGNSLSANFLVIQANKAFDIELNIREIFENPSLKELGDLILVKTGQVSEDQLEGPQGDSSETISIENATDDKVSDGPKSYPLSFAQQRLWFLDRFKGSSAEYNLGRMYPLKGKLNKPAMAKAINTIVARHDSLRTCFKETYSGASQIIYPSLDVPLKEVDLRGLSEEEQKDVIRKENAKPFDLEKLPLVRSTVYQLDDDLHVVEVVVHHIVTDGWSVAVMNRELTTLYGAYCDGKELTLPPLTSQYPDYSKWQRDWLQGDVLDAQLNYWTEHLKGIVNLELPTDRPRPAVHTYNGAALVTSLPEGLGDKMMEFNRDARVTPFMSFLTAFQILLAKHSGQDDIVVGTPIANRQKVDHVKLIGFFVNTLVMRMTLEEDASFNDLVMQVRTNSLNAFQYQDLPFERLVEAINPKRDQSRHPVFQVMFALQNAHGADPVFKDLEEFEYKVGSNSTHFDIELHVMKKADEWVAILLYNTDLYDEATIQRLFDSYVSLLDVLVGNPDMPVKKLTVLSSEEREKLLSEWNDVPACSGSNTLVQNRFEDIAQKHPEEIAVCYEEQSINYGDLNRKANSLAESLRELGVTKNVPVAIFCERSIDSVVALLAAMKAGGVCMPLDSNYPSDRIHGMIEDAQPAVIVAHASLEERLPAALGNVLVLDDEDALEGGETNLPSINEIEDVAYLLYTSGSTGKPKGVEVPHRTLSNLIAWQLQDSGCGLNDSTLQFASFNFDVSFQEVFATLSNGGRLVIVPETVRQDLFGLGDFILKEDPKRIFLPSVALDALAQSLVKLKPGELSAKEIITAGEQLKITPAIRDFFKKLNGAVLLNHYGPTETHVVTSESLDGDPDLWPDLPYIGKPIPGAKIYIVDENLEPVQIGFAGQLLVGGLPVAKGYLNALEKTSEKFMPSPWIDGDRVYCTGDLARYENSGCIEFLGRTDDQVKIRGFRVELGEIESSLIQHPSIRECAVSVYESSQGLKQLAAYYVKQESDSKIADSELKSFLKDRLPEYMVPNTFVALEELPLSPNRKIDRKALPVPVVSKRTSISNQEQYFDLERTMSGIWCKVLDLESVSLTDNFFDVGGHSLLATQLQIRISQYLDVDLTLKDLFENPSIKELASLLADQVNPTAISALDSIEDLEAEDFEIPVNWFPASSQQKRLWFVDHFQGQSPEYTFHQSFKISGELDTECLKKAYEQLIEQHASLRTRFVSKGMQVYQVVEDTVPLNFQVSNLRFRHGNIIGEELENERSVPFDLAQSPLIRARLFMVDENEHILTLSVHHIVADRRSVDVILRDLEILYNALLKGETLQLNAGPGAYSDFSAKQHADHFKDTFNDSLNYWAEKLRKPEPLNIPTDFTRPQTISNTGAIHEFELDRKVVEELKDFSGAGNKSDHAAFLAAFIVLLNRYSRQKDIILGLPVSDRGDDSLEHVVGNFVNTPVVRVDLSDDPNFYSLLRRVSNEVTESTRHHGFPFEKIVELVNPPRDTSRHPIFQVTYSVEGESKRVPQLDGVEIHANLNEAAITHYDLCFELNLNGATPRGLLRYNAALFKSETIERMGRHYDRVLKSLSQNSREAVTKVNYLTDREQEFILGCGMGPSESMLANRCLHQLFEDQAAQKPEKVAVRTGETVLSYGALNRRANHMASVLVNSGIKPGSTVGVHMETSAELLVSLLAVLKIGCAYLPLNIRLPKERLNAVCKESALTSLLIHTEYKDRFEGTNLKLILVDEHEGESESFGALPSVGHDDAAYAIYTSGSTGVPKGTVVNHGSVVNLIEHGISRPGITARDTFLSVASFSFDISVFEMFGPLSVGAELILPTEEERNDVARLVTLLDRHSVTVMLGTPSLWKVMVASGWKGKSSMKILTGGEKLTSELAQDLLDRSGALWNLYGPTETTIFSTANHVKSREDLSLGYPITNTELYVVDEYLNLVPEGVAGELLIGGRGVANGYYVDKSLSLEKFIPNPFSSNPDSMLFRTGDLCRWGPDGKLEYLERVDEQVKISGYRIELGDIEANLIKFPGVEDCAVKAWPEKIEGPSLVGYVVKSKDEVSADDLIAYLRTQLPDYMVPSFIEFLDNLPATVHGKIDKRSLVYPTGDSANASSESSSALSQTEQAIATVWSEILEIDLPGLDEDFFDLGGHSLIAFQVIIRLRNTLDVEISLRELFDHPTVAELSAYILADKKVPSEVLAEELSEPPVEELPSEMNELDAVVEREAPLSFAQSRIWFLEQLEEDMVAYNMFSAAVVEGPFDPEILRRCLETIVARQSSYRTNFILKEGHPVQIVNSPTKFHLPIIDLTHLEEGRQKAEVDDLVKKEASTPFNLKSDLKIRSTVLKCADDKHVLMINQHHIATDGWSSDLLRKELASLYAAYSMGLPSPLPDLESSYAQFSVDQRDQLQGGNWDRLLNYWKTELEGITPLELPTDRPRPNKLSNDGDYESLELDTDLVKRLREFCVTKGSTMHMMVMSTFQVLLARLSGQMDVVVGLPSVTRNSPELENIIGVFLSTLLVRGNLEDNPSFSDFLNQIRFKSLEALDHADMPFELLVDELAPERDLSRNPLFQVLVNSQEQERKRGSVIPGMKFSWIDTGKVHTKFDVTLYTTLGKDKVNFGIVYSKDLFDGSRIRNMFDQFVGLFEQILEGPDKSVWDYSLVTNKQRDFWPLAQQSLPSEDQVSVVHRVLEFADQTPVHSAISMAGNSWTYQELKDSMLHIASNLRAQGLTEGSRVVVDMDRSFGCMASFLGILSIGGVMVPFDPDLPHERKRRMLKQVSPQAIIRSSSGEPESLQDHGLGVQEFVLDETSGKFVGMDAGSISEWFTPGPDSPAYIFFTSGTTGEPKGILGRYRGLNHFINWQREQFGITQDDRASQLTSLSFDVCLRDIFLPLSSGATLCIPPKELSPLSGEVMDWLRDERISVLHTVPSILNSWIQTNRSAQPIETLRWTFSAGEPLKSDLVAQWRSLAKNSEIINLYGPTETTLAKCWYQVPEKPLEGVQPIGAALPGVDVSILNHSGFEAGIGEIGEIGIRTPYASLGYLDEDSDHNASFIPCPWRPATQERIYRTGDQGRLRPDGVIEILGRVDDQIKIRGIRIEPKEVESSIEKHPQVMNCRVLGMDDPAEGKWLIAYIVKEGDLTRSQLSAFLSENLPQAMVPRTFVFLDEIPLTVNGKLDRAKLPKLELIEEDTQQKYVAPRSPIEERLAQIFEELLKVKRVSIYDNFFHLGGNSLLVVRLCYSVFKVLNEKLQVASVFKYPTVALLAKHLGDSVSEKNYLMRLNSEEDGDPIFFIPGIFRTAMVHAEMSKRLDVARPCYGLELPVPENGVEPLKTMEELANHCVQEIKKVQPVGPYTLGGFSFGGVLAYEVAAQLHSLDGQVHRVFMFDSRYRIEESKEPPPSSGRLEWFGEMFKTYKFNFLRFFIKSFCQHHILWRLGLWDGYNQKGGDFAAMLDSGLPFLFSDPYHYYYKPKSVPLRLTVFTVRQFLFTRKGQSELMRWDKFVENQVDYVLVKTDNHNRILDDENLDLMCERMREDMEKDDLSNRR